MTLLHWLLLFAHFMGRSRWQQILTRAVNCQNFGKWNPDKRFGAKSRLKHSGEKPHCSMPIEQWGKANCTGGKSRLKYKGKVSLLNANRRVGKSQLYRGGNPDWSTRRGESLTAQCIMDATHHEKNLIEHMTKCIGARMEEGFAGIFGISSSQSLSSNSHVRAR